MKDIYIYLLVLIIRILRRLFIHFKILSVASYNVCCSVPRRDLALSFTVEPANAYSRAAEKEKKKAKKRKPHSRVLASCTYVGSAPETVVGAFPPPPRAKASSRVSPSPSLLFPLRRFLRSEACACTSHLPSRSSQAHSAASPSRVLEVTTFPASERRRHHDNHEARARAYTRDTHNFTLSIYLLTSVTRSQLIPLMMKKR